MFTLVVYALALMGATPSGATEWTWQPWIGLEGRHSSNLRLSKTSAEEQSTLTALPRLDLSRRRERAQIDASAWLRATGNRNEETLNAVDSFFNLRTQGQSERHTPRLFANYAHDSTIYSEVADTGIVQANTRRNFYQVAPGWEYRLDERHTVALNYNYSRVRYSDGESIGLYDYRYQAADVALKMFMSAKDYWQLSLSSGRYEAVSVDSEFRDVGGQAGVSRAFSATLLGHILLGVRRSESTWRYTVPGLGEVSSSEADTSRTLDLRLERDGERTTLSGNVGRGFEPSGSGYVVLRDRLSFIVNHRATEQINLSLGAEVSRSESLRTDITGIDRIYYRVEPRVIRRLGSRLSVSAGYRYRYQKYDASSTAAVDHAIDARLDYFWDRGRVPW